MILETCLRMLNEFAGELYDLNPEKCTVIFLEGPWVFEVWPTKRPDAKVFVSEMHEPAATKVQYIHYRNLDSEWYDEMGIQNDDYEWSITHGTN